MERFKGFMIGCLFIAAFRIAWGIWGYTQIPTHVKVEMVKHGCAEYVTKDGESIWKWKNEIKEQQKEDIPLTIDKCLCVDTRKQQESEHER